MKLSNSVCYSSVALSLLSVTQLTYAAQSTKQPNILWIITDDHRADALECWNQATRGTSQSELGYVSSPELDKLAKEGTMFVNSYCNSPRSTSSRSSLMSGLYTYHRGTYSSESHHIHPDFMTPMLPDCLEEVGYNTYGIGKMGIRISKKDENGKMQSYTAPDIFLDVKEFQKRGLSDWSKTTIWKDGGKGEEYDNFHAPDGTKMSYARYKKDGLTAEDAEMKRAVEERYKHLIPYLAEDDGEVREGIIGGVSSQPTDKTSDGYITTDFQRYLKAQGKPFKSLSGRKFNGPSPTQPQLFYIGYHFPHTPILPSASFCERFKDKRYIIPEFDKAEYDKMPAQVKRWSMKGHVAQMKKDDREKFIRDYYAYCAMGDSLIGASVRSFKRYCDKNSQDYLIMIAVGDHGWHLGEQGVGAKGQGYLKSNQTAIIVVGSDKSKYPKGKIVEDYVEYVDMFPTLLDAAGIDPNSERFNYLDGYNLVDVERGNKAPREYILGELGGIAFIRTKDFSFSMVTRKQPKFPLNQKAIEAEYKRAMGASLKQVDAGLYDLRVDPKERNNVALDPQYSELAEWFHQKLGTIVLGDRRAEVNWKEMNSFYISTFGVGSDNKKFDAPASMIPKVKRR